MEKKNYLKNLALYGFITGGILIVISFLMYSLHIIPVGVTRIFGVLVLNITVFYLCIYFFSKQIREIFFEGYITYWSSVKIGVFIGIISAFLFSLYNLIFNLFIDPGYMERVITAQKDWMINFMQMGGVPDGTIEKSVSGFDEQIANINHYTDFIVNILWGIFKGFIISLITSAYIKKEKDIFAQQEIIEQN